MKKRMMIIGLTAAAVLMGTGLAQKAAADVRVKATLKTPNLTVTVGNTPYGYRSTVVRRPLPVVRYERHVIVTRDDRATAARLSEYTGVPAQDILYLKSRGYTWTEIGDWLDVRQGVVAAAMDFHTWNRFLRNHRHSRFDTCCDNGCNHDRRVVVVTRGHDDCDDDFDPHERGRGRGRGRR